MPDLTGLKLVQTTCWGNQAWMHGHQCDNLTYGDGDTPPNWCEFCAADVPSEKWDRLYRSTGDPHTGQSEAPASGTGSTLPAEQADTAPSDIEDAQAPTEPLPPPCSLWWRDRESCAEGDVHHCVLIGGHRIHRCVCSASWSSGFTADADVEAGKPDATEQLFADFTTEWLAAGDDAERTEALEDLLDGWYTAWPDTAVTSPHWPIADRLVQMLGPWNGITLADATDDLWLIVAEVLAKGGLDAAMFEDDAREILHRLGFAKVRRRAAMLGPVLLWRDHTAAVLDTLIKAADEQEEPSKALMDAAATARETLAADPEQTYGGAGFDTTVSHTVTNLRTIHRLRHDLATSEERRGRQARIIAGQVSLIANVWALTAHRHRCGPGMSDHDVVSVELLRKALRDGPATNPEPEDLTDDELDVACAIEYLVRHGQPLNARGVRRLEGERDLARQSAEREATNAEQLRQHFDKASRERDTWKSNAEHWENNRNGWHLRALRAEAERDEARRVRDAEQLASRSLRDDTGRLRRRIAALASVEPTQAEYGAAQTAIIDAWPHLAGDAFVDQVAIIAVDAAWKLNGTPRTEDTDPAQAGQDAPDWTGNLYRRIGKQAPATRHASPHCACGINIAGERYVDPICKPAPKLATSGVAEATACEPRCPGCMNCPRPDDQD